jgi:hypothetical protein
MAASGIGMAAYMLPEKNVQIKPTVASALPTVRAFIEVSSCCHATTFMLRFLTRNASFRYGP